MSLREKLFLLRAWLLEFIVLFYQCCFLISILFSVCNFCYLKNKKILPTAWSLEPSNSYILHMDRIRPFVMKVLLDMDGWVWKDTILALHNRAFPKAKNSAVCAQFPVGYGKHIFSNLLINSQNSKIFEEMEYLIHFVKIKR